MSRTCTRKCKAFKHITAEGQSLCSGYSKQGTLNYAIFDSIEGSNNAKFLDRGSSIFLEEYESSKLENIRHVLQTREKEERESCELKALVGYEEIKILSSRIITKSATRTLATHKYSDLDKNVHAKILSLNRMVS